MFTFKDYDIRRDEATVVFKYELIHEDNIYLFSEKVTFDKSKVNFNRVNESVLKSALDALSLILGISYWKTYCPAEINFEHITLSPDQAKFWNTVYTKGLGEFFYKNKIDFRGLVNFSSKRNDDAVSGEVVEKSGKSLLLWGGGKDSIVSAEILKKCGKEFDLFSMNDYTVQRNTAKVLGKELLVVKRELDPVFFELSIKNNVYNGHVPATFIYSATAVVTAILYGYDGVIISCEESANYGNVEYLGQEINHQWSKSYEFELMFGKYIEKYITPSIVYFSLIRPFHEIKVVEEFIKYPQYFNLFSSCNKNFAITKVSTQLWCGECPKCAFVFTLLAGFLSKEVVENIFGKNLYGDSRLTTIYRSLLGLENVKPFDCVGTPEETKLAFWLASVKGEFAESPIMTMFMENFSNQFDKIAKSKDKLFSKNSSVVLPSDCKKCL